MKTLRYVLAAAMLAGLLSACNNDKPAKQAATSHDDVSALRPFHGFNLPPISNFDRPPNGAKK